MARKKNGPKPSDYYYLRSQNLGLSVSLKTSWVQAKQYLD